MLFVGRQDEKKLLNEYLISSESELVAIIGRRRVGKTRLVREVFGAMLDFEMTGSYNASLKSQLANFTKALRKFSKKKSIEKSPDWLDAFSKLEDYLAGKSAKGKKVIFFDELPWIASSDNDFIPQLRHFWKDWAERNNVIIVVSGSAASWMITEVVSRKGSLYGIATRKAINVKPFTLKETAEYFEKKNIELNQYQIIQLYLVMGGIPHYLKEVERGKSVGQIVDSICFSEQGLLEGEFPYLLRSLYEQSKRHETVLKILAGKWKGFTHSDLINKSTLDDESLNQVLRELEESSFISKYNAFGNQDKQTLYRLTDHYSLFYLKFMEPRKTAGKGAFKHLFGTPTWTSWSGYAFENLCLNHQAQIRKALEISDVYTESSSYIVKGGKNKEGAQIDMLLDRNDGIINICEAKFYEEPYKIRKPYADKLENKRAAFKKETGTTKTLLLVMITARGLIANTYSDKLIANSIDSTDLFQ